MVNSTLNYISIFAQRLRQSETISNDEMASFLDGLKEYIDGLEHSLDEMNSKMVSMYNKKNTQSNQSSDNFVQSVLGKIEILKNVIKLKMEPTIDNMFSFHMLTVEAIEKEIIETNTVTKHQLESLNKIYISEQSNK